MDDLAVPTARMFTIAQELAEVGRLVDEDDVPATVDRYVRRAVALLPGCDYAAIMVAGEGDTIEVVAASGSKPLPHPAGDRPMANPVAETIRYREPRRLDNAESDRRWPDYSEYLRRHGYCSGMSLPLPAADSAAAFVVLSGQGGQFGKNSHDLALLFTLQAGVAFDNATVYHDNLRLLDHVQAALRTRTAIAQAQGLLMRHHGWVADQAFAALKRVSQERNLKLRTLAAALVDAHHAGRLAEVLAQYGLTRSETAHQN
jgi:GAF domain-containing protein